MLSLTFAQFLSISHKLCSSKGVVLWIPAFAGMTLVSTGMTLVSTGMTLVSTGMTLVSTGMTLVSTGMTLILVRYPILHLPTVASA